MRKLFIEYLHENTLNEICIKSAHEWFKNHINNQSNVLSIRATGKINNHNENAAKNRARLIHLDKIKYHIVYSDNELATWLYINMPKANFFNKSFQDYISEKTMPVAHFGAKAEGDGRFRVERVTRPWVNIRHSHIFDAGLYSKELIIESSVSEIISRFIRLVHPINHFLFPDNLGVFAEQNSVPEYQYVAALYMKNKFPEIFEEFITLTKPGDLFEWNKDWEKIAKNHIDTLEMPHAIAVQPVQPNLGDVAMIQRLPMNTPGTKKMNKRQGDVREYSVRTIPRGHGINDYTLKIGWWINGSMVNIGEFKFDLELLHQNKIISINSNNEYNFKITRNPINNTFTLGGITLP